MNTVNKWKVWNGNHSSVKFFQIRLNSCTRNSEISEKKEGVYETCTQNKKFCVLHERARVRSSGKEGCRRAITENQSGKKNGRKIVKSEGKSLNETRKIWFLREITSVIKITFSYVFVYGFVKIVKSEKCMQIFIPFATHFNVEAVTKRFVKFMVFKCVAKASGRREHTS